MIDIRKNIWNHDYTRGFLTNYSGRTATDAQDNTVTLTQNPFDQIKQLVDPTGNVTTLNYNARQLASINFPTFTQTVEYDSDNRIDTVTNVLSNEGGGAENQTTALTYDVASNLIATLDAEGNGYTYAVDVLDRITTITDPIAGTIDFDYDRRGNLTRVQDPEGRETRFEYNGNDQLVAEVIGTLSQGTPDTTRREYTYDGNGNLTAIVTPAGGRITFTYNAAGQLTTSEVYANTSIETPEKTISFGRDDIGRLTSYSDATTSATYTYDAVDRVTAVTTNFGPFSKTYSYTYFDNGWIKTYTNPEGVTYTYSYHKDGTLAGVHVPGEGQIALTDYEWLAPQTLTLPGGTTISANYDELLRLDSYTVTDPAGQTIASGIYSYDKVNNILGIVTEDDTKDYGYDALYRLTAANFDQLDDEAYSYDGVGNRLSSTDEPAWQYNDRNQLVSHGTTTYAYDANGNRIKKTESGIDTHYLYNTEERLTQVEDHNHNTIATYYYDPFGLRLYKDVAGTRTHFLYNGEGLAAEYDAAGNLIAEYHYGPNKPWMTEPLFQRRNGNVYYYQTDHLGTPQKLITKSGQIVWQGQYEAFGAVTETIDTVDNPLRFPGQYADDETGTYYNYFRDYDPAIARYLQSDPIGLNGGLNRDIYAFGNSIVYIDPHGEFFIIGAGVGAVIGGLTALTTGQPITAGIISGAVSGAFPGGGFIINLAIGAIAGATGNIAAQFCNEDFDYRSLATSTISGAVGGSLGRLIGFSNGLRLARAGIARRQVAGLSYPVFRAFLAETASSSIASSLVEEGVSN
ncbi:MAG: RHS repeat-associated core domain-containing protein [Pseudomonadales bacterium]